MCGCRKFASGWFGSTLIAPSGGVSTLVVWLMPLSKECIGGICSSSPIGPCLHRLVLPKLFPSQSAQWRQPHRDLVQDEPVAPEVLQGKEPWLRAPASFRLSGSDSLISMGCWDLLGSREALKKTQLLCPCPEWCVPGTHLPLYKEEIKPKCGGRLSLLSCISVLFSTCHSKAPP